MVVVVAVAVSVTVAVAVFVGCWLSVVGCCWIQTSESSETHGEYTSRAGT